MIQIDYRYSLSQNILYFNQGSSGINKKIFWEDNSDTQYNGTRHNDFQHIDSLSIYKLKCDIQRTTLSMATITLMILSTITLNAQWLLHFNILLL